MRELKFRAWNGEDMIYSDAQGWSNFMDNVDPSYKYSHGYKVMQCTGLKDKNGKEIYEGDIFFSKHSDNISQVKYGEHNEDVFRATSVGFYTDQGYGFGRDIHGKLDSYEVIGNIYEYPELLEKL